MFPQLECAVEEFCVENNCPKYSHLGEPLHFFKSFEKHLRHSLRITIIKSERLTEEKYIFI